MPIARFPGGGGGGSTVTSVLLVTPPNAVLDPSPPVPIVAGHAVALVDVGGIPTFFLCSANPVDRPDLFIGFILSPSIVPGATKVVSGRGSTLSPVVEGGGPLTVNSDVFLALTPGEVTQTPPSGPSHVILRVGFASGASAITLSTDFRQVIP